MGLAASQARLLFITARQNDVSARMQKISSANMVLARDEDDIMNKYNQMVNATKLQPLNGDEFSVTYEALMGLTAASNDRITVITNDKGQVVLNATMANYLGLAGDVSPDQAEAKLKAAGINSGDDIKAKLKGPIEEADLGQGKQTNDNKQTDWEGEVESFIKKYGHYPKDTMTKVSDLVDKMGTYSGVGSFKDIYNGSAGVNVQIAGDGDTDATGTENNQARTNLTNIITNIKDVVVTAMGINSDSQGKINAKINEYINNVTGAVNNWSQGDNSDNYYKTDSDPLKDIVYAYASSTGGWDQSDHLMVSYEAVLKKVMSITAQAIGAGDLSYSGGNFTGQKNNAQIGDEWMLCALSDTGYTTVAWEENLKAKYINGGYNDDMTWRKALSIAKGMADSTKETTATSTKVNQKGYYDNLFNALKTKGWIVDGEDVDKKLQDGEYKVAGRDIHYTELYEEVADEETRSKAESFYDQEMKKIQRKEKALDNELTKLNTEYSALTNDYNSVNQILQTNIQKSFQYCQTG